MFGFFYSGRYFGARYFGTRSPLWHPTTHTATTWTPAR